MSFKIPCTLSSVQAVSSHIYPALPCHAQVVMGTHIS